MAYKIIKVLDEDEIQRVSDGAFIPRDPQNQDYREYLAWLEEQPAQ